MPQERLRRHGSSCAAAAGAAPGGRGAACWAAGCGRHSALRAGIKTVIIPDENAKDLTEIPDELKNALDIRTVSRMDEVVKIAFVQPPQPIVWEEEGEEAGKIVPPKEEAPAGVTAH